MCYYQSTQRKERLSFIREHYLYFVIKNKILILPFRQRPALRSRSVENESDSDSPVLKQASKRRKTIDTVSKII